MNVTHPLHAVIEAYNDAWNRHDVDAIVAMHTEDSVFRNHTSGGEAVGRAAIRRIVAGVFDILPRHPFHAAPPVRARRPGRPGMDGEGDAPPSRDVQRHDA